MVGRSPAPPNATQNSAAQSEQQNFNPFSMMGSGIGSLLSMLFGGGNMPNFPNPAQGGMPYLNQISQQLQKYYNPTIQQGQQAYGKYNEALQNMMNPGQLMQQLGAGYKESPGYQFQLGQGTNAAANAAAAGGMMGSPQHQQQASQISQNIANQDYNQYLQNAMGLYGQGAAGMGGIYNQGANAGMNLGNNLAQALMSQAQMAYGGQSQQNMMDLAKYMQKQQQQGGIFGGIGNLIGSATSFLPFLL